MSCANAGTYAKRLATNKKLQLWLQHVSRKERDIHWYSESHVCLWSCQKHGDLLLTMFHPYEKNDDFSARGGIFWCAERVGSIQAHRATSRGTRRSADLSEIWSRKLCDRILGSILWILPIWFSAPPFSIRRIKRKSCGKRCRFVWFPNSRVVDRIWIAFMVISCNVIRLISIIDPEIWQKNKSPQITRMNTDERTSVYTANVLCQDNWRQLDSRSARLATESYIYLSITLIAHYTYSMCLQVNVFQNQNTNR